MMHSDNQRQAMARMAKTLLSCLKQRPRRQASPSLNNNRITRANKRVTHYLAWWSRTQRQALAISNYQQHWAFLLQEISKLVEVVFKITALKFWCYTNNHSILHRIPSWCTIQVRFPRRTVWCLFNRIDRMTSGVHQASPWLQDLWGQAGVSWRESNSQATSRLRRCSQPDLLPARKTRSLWNHLHRSRRPQNPGKTSQESCSAKKDRISNKSNDRWTSGKAMHMRLVTQSMDQRCSTSHCAVNNVSLLSLILGFLMLKFDWFKILNFKTRLDY